MKTTTKVFLVLLRIAIGWHFLYEGVFKIQSDDAGTRYLTSRYFLQASVGRVRDSFNEAASRGRMTPEFVAARLDQWQDEVAAHFKGQDNALTEEQKGDLAALCWKLKAAAGGTLADPEYRAAATDGNPGDSFFNTDWQYVHEQVLKVAAEQEGKQFTSLEYLRSSAGPFRGLFRGLVGDIDGLGRLTRESAQMRIDRRYDEIVRHYESRGHALDSGQRAKLAAVRDKLKESIGATVGEPAFQARLADYKLMKERVDQDRRNAGVPYADERLAADRKKLDTVAGELLAFVNEPLAELTVQAQAIARTDQMKAGPPPRPHGQTELIDWTIKWGLTAIGICLMLGLFTPLAAAAAAVQLAMFYFASPPLPGLPATTMGGHYLYVDRNLIELVAALLLVTTPTGQWVGFDSWVARMIQQFRRRRAVPAAEEVMVSRP